MGYLIMSEETVFKICYLGWLQYTDYILCIISISMFYFFLAFSELCMCILLAPFSLSALGNVINALAMPKRGGHIPYRDSKLTRILEVSHFPRSQYPGLLVFVL